MEIVNILRIKRPPILKPQIVVITKTPKQEGLENSNCDGHINGHSLV